ncbi:hypothetical protein D7Y51_15235 [Stenotrophomonas maltophilia]|nr:hypothetical protein [Stenotrophomonas maltophilia]HEP1208519.1 hypothetical protein [Stenotrophomonas maltophilia]
MWVGHAGHAVNPSLGARWRHPWRQRSCTPHPPGPPYIARAAGKNKIKIKSGSRAARARCHFFSSFPVTPIASELPVEQARLCEVCPLRHRETVEGGGLWVCGVSAAWMPRPSPQGRVYGVPANPQSPASPQYNPEP